MIDAPTETRPPFPAPALIDAVDDPAVTPLALALLGWCHARDRILRDVHGGAYSGWLAVKASGLSLRFRVQRQSIARALDSLETLGYLSSGRADGNVRTVRLILDRNGHG